MQVRCNQGWIALFVWNSKKFLHCFLWTGSVSDKGGWGATVKRTGVFGWQWAKRETAACPGSSIWCSINSSTANSLREEIIHRYLIFLDHIWSMVPWTAWVLQYKKDLDQLECHQGTEVAEGEGLETWAGCVMDSFGRSLSVCIDRMIHWDDKASLSVTQWKNEGQCTEMETEERVYN